MPISFIDNGLRLHRLAHDADCYLRYACCIKGVMHTLEIKVTNAGNIELQAFMDQCAAVAATANAT